MKRRPIDYERIAYFIAAEESARFYLKEMNKADNHVTRNRLLLASIKAVTIDGLWLEFGVHRGESLRIIGSKAKSTVYGFDSFEGLPEDWTSFQKKRTLFPRRRTTRKYAFKRGINQRMV